MKNQNNLQIGQANTPLIRLSNLEEKLEWLGSLWAKAEYQNPTGSFKDRGSAAEITEALRQKKAGVVCASTGNMAASLAAYAAKANLQCVVVVPKNTPSNKLQQALMCGAKIIDRDENYDACISTAEEIAKKMNFLLCGDYALRRSGQVTIGEELAKDPINFDGFICPVGNGTVGCAIAEGFANLQKFPSFIGVQGKGADPLTIAWQTRSATFMPIAKPQTVALAMNVGKPLDGNLTLKLVRKTNGMLLSVSNEEIIAAQKLLAITEGIYVEPAAAATLAAVEKLANRKQCLVLILTGHGLKSPSVN